MSHQAPPELTARAIVLAIAGLGGLLGVLFSVPLRHSLIVERASASTEGDFTVLTSHGRVLVTTVSFVPDRPSGS